jgi:hypothetical protein
MTTVTGLTVVATDEDSPGLLTLGVVYEGSFISFAAVKNGALASLAGSPVSQALQAAAAAPPPEPPAAS